jgi:uncharacterized membrane protein YdjX (TVP38/TMEM64 family)
VSPEVLGLCALLGVALGSLVGIPISPLYILIGAVWGWWGLPLLALAVAVHLWLSYLLATRWLKAPIERLLARWFKGAPLPQVQGSGSRWVLLARFTPGLPLWIQSYLLALGGVPWLTYFWVSLLAQMIWGAGFIIAGGAIVSGQWSLLLLGVCIVAAVILAYRQYGRARPR